MMTAPLARIAVVSRKYRAAFSHAACDSNDAAKAP